MREIETDYLVIGAGASGMAFVDALVGASDADVVLVDRRHAPGGHWLDAYPFVRLHQPSANYGVSSRVLGNDRIDEHGINAGFYERASAAEICSYFAKVLDDDLVPTGRVRFLGTSDYRGADADGHHVTSLLTGEETTITVRRKVVDATYVESTIPSRHTPGFVVDDDARLVAPNDLVDMDEPANGFTVIGCGKTAMDTCCWLLEAGVDPGDIEWVRPRDPWLFNRASMQPLDQVGAYMHLQASWLQAAAKAEDGIAFARALEDDDVMVRIDPKQDARAFRGATISMREIEALRTIERLVRRRVLRIGAERMVTEEGDVTTGAGRVYVDCTAAGVRPTVARPVFEDGRITLQYVTIGIVPLGAAIIGVVEARTDDDAAKNAFCPPLAFSGDIADVPTMAYAGMNGLIARASDPTLNAWIDSSRLNPARGASEHLDDPRVGAAFTVMGESLGPAMANLHRLVQAAPAAAG